MLATDVAPNRLAAAKKAAGTFLDAVPDQVRVGASPSTRRPTCCSRRRATTTPCARRSQSIKAAGTHRHRRRDQGRARDASRARRPPRSCCSPTASRCAAATRSPPRGRPRQRKIPIYTVALGTADGHDQRRRSPCRPTRRRSPRSRRSPAAARSRPATSTSLDQVYKRLGSQVATEKRKLEVTNLFAGGALALMALSALSSIRLFGRVL